LSWTRAVVPSIRLTVSRALEQYQRIERIVWAICLRLRSACFLGVGLMVDGFWAVLLGSAPSKGIRPRGSLVGDPSSGKGFRSSPERSDGSERRARENSRVLYACRASVGAFCFYGCASLLSGPSLGCSSRRHASSPEPQLGRVVPVRLGRSSRGDAPIGCRRFECWRCQ
jgi:hypothetical protein